MIQVTLPRELIRGAHAPALMARLDPGPTARLVRARSARWVGTLESGIGSVARCLATCAGSGTSAPRVEKLYVKPWIFIAMAAFAACTAQRNGGQDHRDAHVRTPDARVDHDARVATPDANVATPDANAATPDANAATPDANVDERPDAHATGDAGSSALRSAGCGLDATATGDFVTRTITVRGTARTYRLRVPATYDRNRAYPIVFRWHGAGGDGLSGGLGVEYSAGNDAIVVGGDALGGWWDLTPEGPDVAFFDAMRAELESQLCIDKRREFSYGFSRGGGLSHLLACTRADVLRGSAAVAGLAAWSVTCSTPVATWLLHDSDDGAVPIGDGVAMRDRFVAANGCEATTAPVDPSPCVQYQGCLPGEPVVWCQTSGVGHNPRGDLAPAAVWSFFSSLP